MAGCLVIDICYGLPGGFKCGIMMTRGHVNLSNREPRITYHDNIVVTPALLLDLGECIIDVQSLLRALAEDVSLRKHCTTRVWIDYYVASFTPVS
jgi:hypothetical protein